MHVNSTTSILPNKASKSNNPTLSKLYLNHLIIFIKPKYLTNTDTNSNIHPKQVKS
ncbi:hypothetical protein Hanom_Chr10g00933071 [Helianthus anomalus]